MFASVLATGYLAQLLPYQFFTYASIQSAAVFSLILGLVNAVIRPIVVLLTLPLTCLTLGLFTIVVNGLMFLLATQLTASVGASGIYVAGFPGAIVAALIVSVISTLLSRFVEA